VQSRRLALVVALLATLLVAACGVESGTPPADASVSPAATEPAAGEPTATATHPGSVEPVDLTVGLGYIPSVQFAPFYLADQKGYYAEAGVGVTFQNEIDANLVPKVGTGQVDIGVADGTSVIPAVSQGIPISYVATIYGTYPSIVFAKASAGITTAADLKGKKIAIPGKYGSSWIMLQALLDSAGMTPDDATVIEYPDFGQGVAVQQGAVDAATGFANNEPVVLERNGEAVQVLHVDDVVALPGPGLIAGRSTLDAKADAIRAFVAATLRAMRDIAAQPAIGLDAAIAAVPELASDRAGQLAILEATIATWARPGTSGTDSFGSIDRAGWEASLAYLTKLKLVPNPVSVDDLIRPDFLPAAP
jgi:NitT/TauT family transport system substrate-binding protein